MKKLFLVWVLLIAAIGSAAAMSKSDTLTTEVSSELLQDKKVQWHLMVGSWYGKRLLKEGGYLEWIVNRSADGRYKIQFKSDDLDQCEVGVWGISSETYFSIAKGWLKGKQFTPVDPTDPYSHKVFEMISLTESEFTYKNKETGIISTETRVPDDFTFSKSQHNK